MEELIEVNLTRREISLLVDMLGTTAFGQCDQVTSDLSDELFDGLKAIAKAYQIAYVGQNIGDPLSKDGVRFVINPSYTIRNV